MKIAFDFVPVFVVSHLPTQDKYQLRQLFKNLDKIYYLKQTQILQTNQAKNDGNQSFQGKKSPRIERHFEFKGSFWPLEATRAQKG